MKTLVVALFVGFFALSGTLLGDVPVRGHYRSDGTYVPGHWRSDPNSTTLDNWSTRGNVNPYTGKPGYKSP